MEDPIGPCAYLPPELVAPMGGTRHTAKPSFVQDCYSLGLSLFESMTGEPPWG